MTEPSDEISFHLRLRRDRTRNRAWLVVPMSAGTTTRLEMIPNSVATRSVITPATYQELRALGLTGLDIFDFATGRVTTILRNIRIGDRPAPDLEVQVRDVDELLAPGGRYLVDGYLGLDYLFFGEFGSITIDTRSLRLTLRRDS